MKVLQEKTKLFIISVLAIAGLFLNSTVIIAEGNILYQKNYSVESNGSLLVKMVSADIDVTSWNEDEVSIVIFGNDIIKDYLDFQFSHSGSSVKLVTEKNSTINSWSGFRDFKVKIKVPKEFNLELKTSGGDVELKSVIGIIEMKTSGGDIDVDDSEGELSAKTSGGDIEIDGFTGDVVLKTSGGDIDGKRIYGAVEAKTSGGDVELSVSNGSILAGTSGGDVELDYFGKNNGVELYTSGGDITVKIPSDFSADVVLKASGGDIENNFKTVHMSKITKSKFEGKYNEGGKSFSVKTSGGSILINQK